MAKTMSIIRYKYKADRDFESVQFEGLSCPLGELKRLIIEKSTRSGGHHSREDYDLIISDSTTHEEYKDPMDMIKRNTSVVVTRRMRGMFESLTPSTTRKPGISSDEIVNKYLRPVIGTSAVAEMKPVPLEAFNQPPSNNNNNNNNSSEDFNEEERLKQVLKSSQPTYMPVAHRSNTSYICHNCKQPGHLRNQCPLLLVGSIFGMDSSDMIILEYQRRSLFSVIFSSSIPFCKSDYFITKNKDAVRHHHHRIKDVNHIRSPHHVESF